MAKYLRPKHAMKKTIALILTVLLLFNMTSCAGISSFNAFFGDTVPNVIADQIKKDVISSNSESASTTAPQSNGDPLQNNSNIQNDTEPPSSETDSEADYVAIINTITTDTIKACVNIRTAEYEDATSSLPTRSSIGSGVIFKVEKELNTYHYYVLTNYHVLKLSDNCKFYNYAIKDYLGTEYRAVKPTWLKDDATKTFFEEHDLAVLEFETATELKAIELETKDPGAEETVISIGQPKGQFNAITIGMVESYTEVAIENSVSPSFQVIAHTAPIDHGNSGGAVINTDFKLVGINFAGSWNDDGSFAYGYAIPIETVRKFTTEFGITL